MVFNCIMTLCFQDFDECSRDDTNNCHQDATCQNYIASFGCTCNQGYIGNGVTCSGKKRGIFSRNENEMSLCNICRVIVLIDIDECVSNTHNCDPHASCTNSVGSFGCTCNTGFSGDGRNCTGKTNCDCRIDG